MPAARERPITAVNAGQLRARILAAAANGPTTPDADLILRERGVVVIPDILCNAGRVTVSCFAWVQKRKRRRWIREEVDARLRRVMLRAFNEAWSLAGEHESDAYVAAHILAGERVANARLRGGCRRSDRERAELREEHQTWRVERSSLGMRFTPC